MAADPTDRQPEGDDGPDRARPGAGSDGHSNGDDVAADRTAAGQAADDADAELRVDGGLAQQVGLLAELLGAEPGELTDGELVDGLVALARLSGQVEAALCSIASCFDARSVHSGDGARSTASWLAARSELSSTATSGVVRLARTLRSCPVVSGAFRDGVLGLAKVRMLVRARERVEALFAEHEAELVEVVRPLTVAQARVAIDRWRRLALASVGLDEDPVPTDEGANRLHVSATFEGRRAIDGDLDAVSGSKLQEFLEAEVDRLFRAGEFHAGDGLAASQRSARALMNLVEAGSKVGSRHGEARPSVVVHVDAALLAGLYADGPDQVDRFACTLADGTSIPRSVAERLMCEGDLSELLVRFGLDGTVEVLGATRRTRLVTAKERRALVVRDGGCVFPGCSMPAKWTDAHHTKPYALFGRTCLDELVLLCRFHHGVVHDKGFTLTRHRDGRIEVLRPDGSAVEAARHGHQVPLDPPDPPPGPCTTVTARFDGSDPPAMDTSAEDPPATDAPGNESADGMHRGEGSSPPDRGRAPSRFRPLAERRTVAERRHALLKARERGMVAEIFQAEMARIWAKRAERERADAS